jgi:hypothetical protein
LVDTTLVAIAVSTKLSDADVPATGAIHGAAWAPDDILSRLALDQPSVTLESRAHLNIVRDAEVAGFYEIECGLKGDFWYQVKIVVALEPADLGSTSSRCGTAILAAGRVMTPIDGVGWWF